MKVSCGKCRQFVGEADEPVVYVESVPTGRNSVEELKVAPPRLSYICKSCGLLNAYVPLADLDARRDAA